MPQTIDHTRHAVHPAMTAVCQDSRRLGQTAFQRVASLIANGNKNGKGPGGYNGNGLSHSNTPVGAHAAWLEINETTAPPPEVAYHVLPNRTRTAANGLFADATADPVTARRRPSG